MFSMGLCVSITLNLKVQMHGIKLWQHAVLWLRSDFLAANSEAETPYPAVLWGSADADPGDPRKQQQAEGVVGLLGSHTGPHLIPWGAGLVCWSEGVDHWMQATPSREV